MAYDIEISEAPHQPVIATRIHTSRARIGDDIGRNFGLLMQAMGSGGVVGSGPPLIVYHDVIDENTDGDIEICVPVAGPISGDGAVYFRVLEGGRMAATVHRGPYQDLRSAYAALMGWIAEHGHQIAGPPREIYLNDPQTVPPADLLTRVEFPIGA